MKSVSEKIKQEKEIVSQMIKIYCYKKHKTKLGLCTQCKELDLYAKERSDSCPFIKDKTFCSNCKVHCYKVDMREKICDVMRFSGPRIIFYHPIVAVRHLIENKKEKQKLEKKQ